MITHIFRKIYIMLSLLSIFMVQNIFSGLQLVISPYEQSGNHTCWAACSKMILDAYQIQDSYGASISEQEILNQAVDGADVKNYLFGYSYSVDMILAYWGSIQSNPTSPNSQGYGNLSQLNLTAEIDDGRPIISQWDYSDGSEDHDVLIIGYDGTGGSDAGKVIYNDPSLNNSENPKYLSYATFVQTGTSRWWYATLRLTTNPDYPIPTPIGGSNWVQVNTGGTTVVTPTTSSLSYSASSCCKSITWNWNLIFTDVNGPVVVASSSQPTDNSNTTTWNITNFAMPAGHQWYYNYNGKIPGRVELSATIESEQIYDWKDVIFVPSVLYPGYIVFANQTVSSSHADVKAHTSVSLTNDAITSTGNVSFKAGNKININDGVTIQNGSLTNFIIDQGLQ